MSKLSAEDKFIDVSDYGRPMAVVIANLLKNTSATPVHLTLLFGMCGLAAVASMLQGYLVLAGILLILKSVFDAADGELARIKQIPSYTGRYLDSVFDIVLNLLILLTIWTMTEYSIWITLIAFVCLQMQGTLYNYYYVILRHHSASGDKTSQIFETKRPVAYERESQNTVNFLYLLYTLFYTVYDRIIYKLDHNAPQAKRFPNWFMTLISIYGLGFQLLIISVMLAAGWVDHIIPFFISYSIFILLFIATRKLFLAQR